MHKTNTKQSKANIKLDEITVTQEQFDLMEKEGKVILVYVYDDIDHQLERIFQIKRASCYFTRFMRYAKVVVIKKKLLKYLKTDFADTMDNQCSW